MFVSVCKPLFSKYFEYELKVVCMCVCVLQLSLLNPINNPQLELAIVMLIVPFFVNVSTVHLGLCHEDVFH